MLFSTLIFELVKHHKDVSVPAHQGLSFSYISAPCFLIDVITSFMQVKALS